MEKSLEEKTEERMLKAGLMAGPTDVSVVDDTDVSVVDDPEVKPDVEPDVKLDDPGDNVETLISDDIVDDTKDDEAVVDDSGYEVPDNYRRAAIHQNWTEDEINGFVEASPELAEKTFKKLFESTNQLTQQFAKAGRDMLSQPITESPTRQPQQPIQQQRITDVDIQAMKDEYGDDDPMLGVVLRLNDALNSSSVQQPVQISPVQQPVQQEQVRNEIDEVIGMKLEQFFKDESVIVDKNFYGTGLGWKELTPGQDANRMAVLETGDQIKTGAAAQGINFTHEEALMKAHDMFTAQFAQSFARQSISKTLKKREANLTIEPTTTPAVVENKGPLTENQVVNRAGKRLEQLFKSS